MQINRHSKTKNTIMLQEKAGEAAGKIWNALNDNGGELSVKDLKKVTKYRADKDLYMGLGWLLREDKIVTEEITGDVLVKLK